MNNNYKFLAMAMGVLSQYTHSMDYTINYRSNIMSTFAILQLRAIKNGFWNNKLDSLFVQQALNMTNADEMDGKLTSEELNEVACIMMMRFNRHISVDFILSQLKSKGFTQSDVAEKLGLSLPTVQRWTSGKTEPKSEEDIIKLFDLYLQTEVEI